MIFESPSPTALAFFSSPELSAYSIPLLWCPSSSVCPQCSNSFSETTWPIKAKLHVEPPWEGGTKFYINDPGHMTKNAAMPIYHVYVQYMVKASMEPEVL